MVNCLLLKIKDQPKGTVHSEVLSLPTDLFEREDSFEFKGYKEIGEFSNITDYIRSSDGTVYVHLRSALANRITEYSTQIKESLDKLKSDIGFTGRSEDLEKMILDRIPIRGDLYGARYTFLDLVNVRRIEKKSVFLQSDCDESLERVETFALVSRLLCGRNPIPANVEIERVGKLDCLIGDFSYSTSPSYGIMRIKHVGEEFVEENYVDSIPF